MRHARIRFHREKTHVWNMTGVGPEGCDVLKRLAQHLEARVRFQLQSKATPLGHDEYVRAQLELKSMERDVLLSRIPSVADV